ncbi:MAG: 5'/3'-nucleotidase SurE [Verrucomicrobiales bacterium]|nr:5'/3'-nucleotidase SurE [Verrucomicrobiales bacterium]
MGSIVLLTNDDGIDAPGLAALKQAVADRFDEIWVVAPAEEASQVGHRVTTHGEIGVKQLDDRQFAITGTPADCTRLALAELLPKRPDLVISGINFGGNLGRHDFVISGTIAAAREAVFHGIPAIAVSNYHRADEKFCWETSAAMTERVLEKLSQTNSLSPGEFWNVNLPHATPGIEKSVDLEFCEQETQPLELNFEPEEDGNGFRYTGRYQARPASVGSDVAVCFDGNIAISSVSI